jgi:hypothetical protein
MDASAQSNSWRWIVAARGEVAHLGMRTECGLYTACGRSLTEADPAGEERRCHWCEQVQGMLPADTAGVADPGAGCGA